MSELRRFAAMGCDVLVAGADEAELAAVRELFAERERRFSRFREDSELQHVNRRAGRPVVVSEDFAAMVELALWAAAETAGLVVPAIGDALAAAGYDRDYPLLAAGGPREAAVRAAPAGPSRPVPRLHGRLLTMPPGCVLDLNGVVKSATVDDAMALVRGDGWISAGGDLATRGGVGVALPGGGHVHLAAGGIATSGRTRRSWTVAGRRRHHLIDPVTGSPSRSPWEQVTACGGSCVDADVAAKAAFLLGDAGPAWLDQRGMPGRFLAEGNRVTRNRAWLEAVPGPEAACT